MRNGERRGIMGKGQTRKRGGGHGENVDVDLLSGFVAQAAPSGLVLAAAENVPDQTFSAE
jgi:hypothetical protein